MKCTLDQADSSGLAHVVGAHERVLAIAKRALEESVVDVFGFVFQQVVHVKIATDGGDGEALVDETLLGPPVMLKHERDNLSIHGRMDILIVRIGVRVGAEARNTNNVLNLVFLLRSKEFGELKVLGNQCIHTRREDVGDTIGGGAPSFLVLQIERNNLMSADAFQEIGFAGVACGGADGKFSTFVEKSDGGLADAAGGAGN